MRVVQLKNEEIREYHELSNVHFKNNTDYYNSIIDVSSEIYNSLKNTCDLNKLNINDIIDILFNEYDDVFYMYSITGLNRPDSIFLTVYDLLLTTLNLIYNDSDIKTYNFYNTDTDNSYRKGVVYLNDSYKNKVVYNSIKLTFTQFYPTHLNTLLNNSHYKFNFSLNKFNEIYNDLLINYKSTKHKIVKLMINMTFGILSSNKSILNTDSSIINLLFLKVQHIMNTFKNDFKFNIISIDTDEIVFAHFDKIDEDVYKLLDTINTPYYLEQINYLGLHTKRFVEFPKDSDIRIKGFKQIKCLRYDI